MLKILMYPWNFIFNHEVSPLRHISDVSTRHYILQALGLMWAVCSTIALGSYTLVAASMVAHTLLIGAAAVTAATYTAAAVKPALFTTSAGRRADGEHQ